MGLEHLKSVFSDINTNVDTRETGTLFGSNFNPPTTNLSYDDISLYDFGTTIPTVDYQNNIDGGFIFTPPQPFPNGFTLNFNTPGYSFGNSALGNSKFINITTQNYGTLNSHIVDSQFTQLYSVTPGFNFNDEEMGDSKLIDIPHNFGTLDPINTDYSGQFSTFNYSPLLDLNNNDVYTGILDGDNLTPADDLLGPQFYPISADSRHIEYQTLTASSPIGIGATTTTILGNSIGNNKDYDGMEFDPRSSIGKKTNFNFGRNILPEFNKNDYTGTVYDDKIKIGADRFSYFSMTRTFDVDESKPEISFNNPPTSFLNVISGEEASKLIDLFDNTDTTISKQFDLLYNTNHTATKLKESLNPNMKKGSLNLSQLSSRGGDEPYIVTELGSDLVSGRSLPLKRSITDIKRLSSYLFSIDGLKFFAKQNLLGLNSMINFSDTDTSGNLNVPIELDKVSSRKLYSTKQRFKSSYLPTSTLIAAARAYGNGTPNLLVSRDFPAGLLGGNDPISSNLGIVPSYSSTVINSSQDNSFTPPTAGDGSGFKSIIGNKLKSIAGLPTEVTRLQSDKVTTIPLRKGKTLKKALKNTVAIVGAPIDTTYKDLSDFEDNEVHGMPFYFKDLRDNTYIIFRAYLSGITEDVSPSWSSENYIGRSESVYIYERADRSVTFSLRLAANTEKELNYIYSKLDRLTSLCYPEYVNSQAITSKVLMKPPLISFRMGELFGNKKKNQTSFIKSISYTYGDSSPWETIPGKRVPKYVDATISLQILHDDVPGLSTTEDKKLNFHGFAGTF